MPISLTWADVPVLDLNRASTFYSKMLGVEVMALPGMDNVAVVPSDNGISVDLAQGTPIKPSTTHGTTIYFSSNGDIDGMVRRAVEAGGQVLAEKRFMGPMIGWIAFIVDTEGNRIGIQQPATEAEGGRPEKAAD
jgi:uncharacterized protein